MTSRYEVEVTVSSAKDLKNVNWRNGPNRPYAVVWVDPNNKSSTKVDQGGDTSPVWDQTLVIPLPSGSVRDATLFIDVLHFGEEEDTKALIGSAKLELRDLLDDAGMGETVKRSLQLKRPSGRPQGKVVARVRVKELRYPAVDPYHAPPYGVPPPQTSVPPVAYGNPYAPPQGQNPYYAAPPPPSAGAPPVVYGYGNVGYNPPSAYGQGSYSYGRGQGQGQVQEDRKKSKFGGMGTGLAVGAMAGMLGGIALAEGAEYFEDKVAEKAANKVEEDFGYDF